MDTVETLSTLLLTPLVAAGLIALLFRRSRHGGAVISVLAAGVIAVLSLLFLLKWDGQVFHWSVPWMKLGNFQINMGYLIDGQAATMLLVVSFVAFWIHVFSVGYMDDDEGKGRYFAGLSIFMFAILGIVLASNLIMIFVFWELVGFASYMLIAHYYRTGYATMASKKAFIVNRVGDFGFLIGIIWCYWHFRTVDLRELASIVKTDPGALRTGIGLLLMCGFLGKSAQFPLHVWLTDAMAGPTPVSALIHAATMVAAGVYFMARVFFLLTPEVQTVIMWIGAGMAAVAGLFALGQSDIKKSLAYSTLSHLGYMGCAIGLGYPALALMHMAMHACFKATLFLGAGSVIHATHHEQDIFRMGGLFRRMPVTGLTFLLASLAIAAFPFTSGYFSKDAIISAAYLDGRMAVFAVLLFAALGTALYMGRLFWTVFCGKPNTEHAEHAHESSPWMTIPLVVLAALSIGAGWSVYHWTWADGAMNGALPSLAAETFVPVFHDIHSRAQETGAQSLLMGAGLAACLGGFAITYFLYGLGAPQDGVQRRWPLAYHILNKHGWFDDVYDWYVTRIQHRVCDLLAFLDLILISGLLVRGSALLTGLMGMVARTAHTGSVHGYVYWFVGGVVFFWAFAQGWFN